MRLEPLYRATFSYREGWAVDVAAEEQHFLLAEGRCEGRVSGRFRGANHPRRRSDGTFMPNFQGVIETDDGATIAFDYGGYGRTYPPEARQIVGWATHLSADERYAFLNEGVCAVAGEVRLQPEGPAVLTIDVAELVWEPLEETARVP